MLKKLGWVALGAVVGVVGFTGAVTYYLRGAMK